MSNYKSVVFSSNFSSLNLIEFLVQRADLVGVIIALSNEHQTRAESEHFASYLKQRGIPTECIEHSATSIESLLDRWQANWGVVYNFSAKLPDRVIEYFGNERLINIHASALPNFRGAAPIYWQIRQGADSIPVTLHKLTSEWDAGDIGARLDISLHPMDTHQRAAGKIAFSVVQLLKEFWLQYETSDFHWQPQNMSYALSKAPRVQAADLLLPWHIHTSKEFVDATRAGNPHFGGIQVQTTRGICNILQCSVSVQPTYGVKAGGVVSCDKSGGLVVAVKDGAIVLDVIGTREGVFSGYQFAMVNGVQAGMPL